MQKKRKDVTSCGCLVYRWDDAVGKGPEVLLVKPFRDREAWGAPKGHIDEGESFVDCAKREVLEETGLEVIVNAEEALPVCKTKNHHENKTVRIYLGLPLQPNAALQGDGENDDMRWFATNELPELHKYQRETIEAGVKRVEELWANRGKFPTRPSQRYESKVTPEQLGADFFMNVFNSDGDT